MSCQYSVPNTSSIKFSEIKNCWISSFLFTFVMTLLHVLFLNVESAFENQAIKDKCRIWILNRKWTRLQLLWTRKQVSFHYINTAILLEQRKRIIDSTGITFIIQRIFVPPHTFLHFLYPPCNFILKTIISMYSICKAVVGLYMVPCYFYFGTMNVLVCTVCVLCLLPGLYCANNTWNEI